MNDFVKKISLAALVITVLGTGFSGQARAGEFSAEGYLQLAGISIGVVTDRHKVKKHYGHSLRHYHKSHRSYHQQRKHKKKVFKRKRLHGKGPRHSGFHRHGNFGHSHSYSRAHRH